MTFEKFDFDEDEDDAETCSRLYEDFSSSAAVSSVTSRAQEYSELIKSLSINLEISAYGETGVAFAPTKEMLDALKDLGDEDCNTRDRASRTLADLGMQALPILKRALSSDDAEVVRRGRRLVDKLMERYYEPTGSELELAFNQARRERTASSIDNFLQMTLRRNSKPDAVETAELAASLLPGTSWSEAHRNRLMEWQSDTSPRGGVGSLRAEIAQESMSVRFEESDSVESLASVLQQCKKIEWLTLSKKPDWDKIPDVATLTRLTMEFDDVSNEDVAHLTKFQNLEELTLKWTSIGDDALDVIAGLPNLNVLELSKTKIGDAGIRNLSDYKGQKLHLSGNDVTDDAIPWLVRMTNLRELSLHDTLLTPEGIERLKAALPQCKIGYSQRGRGLK